jgi:hypothetical protein
LAGVIFADLAPYTMVDRAVSSGSHAAMSDSSPMALLVLRLVAVVVASTVAFLSSWF